MEAYFAGGCFWCITPTFKNIDGVINVTSGYCGGDYVSPKYEEVKAQLTDHRETIKIEYDKDKVSYLKLLNIFFNSVDLYDGGGQYIDRGFSYTLAIYYVDDIQKKVIENRLLEFDRKPCISLEKYKKFYEAEEYHQDYYLKNPIDFEQELINSGRKKQ